MKRVDLEKYVAEDCNISLYHAKLVVDSVFEGIEDAIYREGRATITNFGTFLVVKREGRNATNPRTGEPLVVPPKFVPKFNPSGRLKRTVRLYWDSKL